MTRYSPREVARLVGISEAQIRYWHRTGLIPGEGDRARFDFRALVAFRMVKQLLNKGVSVRRIRKALVRLQRILPDTPLTEMQVVLEGDELVFERDRLKFTSQGQLLLDFSPASAQAAALPLRVKPSEELFFEALELEGAGAWEDARDKYEAVLRHEPDHADARVNLGNVFYEGGLGAQAEQCYRTVLRHDPDHAEANYNLANLLEERADLDNAILLYEKAIHEDPDFSDAHFNLARAL
jgi:tetratricopeptide (TPR) repeat protein